MASSSGSLWQCSTCLFAKNTWEEVECRMCGAAVSAKRPASPIPASIAVASKPSKVSRKAAEAKMKPPPPRSSSPHHPSGVVVEIVGMERGDQGCSCEEHEVKCGEVLAEDVVVRLRTHDVEHTRFVLIRAVGATLCNEMRPIVK